MVCMVCRALPRIPKVMRHMGSLVEWCVFSLLNNVTQAPRRLVFASDLDWQHDAFVQSYQEGLIRDRHNAATILQAELPDQRLFYHRRDSLTTATCPYDIETDTNNQQDATRGSSGSSTINTAILHALAKAFNGNQ